MGLREITDNYLENKAGDEPLKEVLRIAADIVDRTSSYNTLMVYLRAYKMLDANAVDKDFLQAVNEVTLDGTVNAVALT